MLPFLVGRLGDEWYGIWIIVGSITGYCYLVDFGLATAVSRYVTQYIVKNDSYNANIIINTSLVIYCSMALLMIGITIVAAHLAQHFIADADNLRIVRLVILIMGLNMAAEFPFKAFSGIIGAYIRYDLLTYSHLLKLVLSTGLIVYFLTKGHGIIALSLIIFLTSQVSNIIFYYVAKHLFHDLRIGVNHFRKGKIRELFNYSAWSFLKQIGDQVRFRIDSVVIGFIMSAAYVTHYFIGARLVELFQSLAYRSTNIMTPVFTKYYVLEKYDEMRSKFLFMTKINTIIAVFGGGLIIILGKSFISRWMGAKYLDAYPVLVLLMIAMIFEIIITPSGNVLYAVSKHRYLSILNMTEGMVNIVLSLVFIRYYGILGVALGTAVPLLITRLFVIPHYVCRCIDLPVKEFYSSISATIILTASYLGTFYVITKDMLIVPEYARLFIAVITAVPLYLLFVLFILFDKSEQALLRSILPKQIQSKYFTQA
jgi:O-antigen/teichoic acid export membrane protein